MCLVKSTPLLNLFQPPPVRWFLRRSSPDDAWGLTAADVAACREQIKALRNDGLFTPPSFQGSLVYPGDVGGMNWSGVSFDPGRGLIIANTNRFVRAVTLIPRDRG